MRPLAEVPAEAALGAAPDVVGEADRGHEPHVAAQAGEPADDRQAQAAVVDGGRPGGEQRVDELVCAVREAAQVAAGGAVAERQLDLLDAQPGAGGVDRRAHLAAEAGGKREDGAARGGRKRALARERLARVDARQRLDQHAGRALGDAEAAALPLGERGDGQVGVGLVERPQVAGQVGVGKEQPPRRRLALGRGERLALAAPRQAHDPRPRLLRARRGRVA